MSGKIEIGTRVRVTHKAEHDSEYQAEAAVPRRSCDGLIGEVKERSDAHGLCFRVLPDERDFGAWFDPDELTPAEPVESIADLRADLASTKAAHAVDVVRHAWEGEAAENMIAALDAVDRALRGVPAPATEPRQCEACTAANGTATFHAPEEPCDPRPDLGIEERLQRLEAVAREFGAHVTAQRGRIEALEKRTGFEPGTIAGSVERLRARLHEGDAAKRLPRVVHEALIERAIGMFVEDMAWNRLAQEQRDRIWGALRWLVDASHGVDTAAPFDADDAPIEP